MALQDKYRELVTAAQTAGVTGLQVREQDNVTIIGEETGGGAYGNNAWLIPDVTLPTTGVRFRLPLFRLGRQGSQPAIPGEKNSSD